MSRRSGAVTAIACLLLLGAPHAGTAQTTLGRSPNLRPAWTLPGGQTALRIGHRFEFLSGGDELLNIPTLSLGVGLGRRLVAGIDFTSNSEIAASQLGGNEAQFWLGAAPVATRRAGLDLSIGWNTAVPSLDAAATGRLTTGRLTLLAEAKAFQDALGSGDAGTAGTIGALLSLTPMLELSGDLGRIFTPEQTPTVWSAGVAIVVPGSPHTLSLHATNGSATTFQGASHRRVLGEAAVRYGFVFTVPLGSGRQWAAIFKRGTPPADHPAGADAVVALRQIALEPREIRIRAGQAVAWVNHDPLPHTVTADDGSWDSGIILQGGQHLQRFDRPGRYTYHCTPHPQMRGVVIVT